MDINNDLINQELMQFIDETPNAFSCVKNIATRLCADGYVELKENKSWHIEVLKKYFVVRNDSSIIAFQVSDNKNNGFNIVATHGDSPSFSIKPGNEIIENGYLKLNTDRYGGMIYYTWMDRPLSLAGRVIIRKNNQYFTEIIDFNRDLLVIPSQAIHLNREINEKNNLNPQIDLLPIMALDSKIGKLKMMLEKLFSDSEICDYDLFLYNRNKACYCGCDNDFILAPRLDDLGCTFSALRAFLDASNDTNKMFCCFNNEEVGSLTQAGADSTFLSDVINRICLEQDTDVYQVISNSMLVSADNGHAIHPNAPAKSDLTNKVELNKGIVIKHHINYTTDALSASIFRKICQDANIPCQDFTCRSDLRCGATLGGISLSHVSVTAVDVGLPQLAMHSALETIGSKDVYQMYLGLKAFYRQNMSLLKSNF